MLCCRIVCIVYLFVPLLSKSKTRAGPKILKPKKSIEMAFDMDEEICKIVRSILIARTNEGTTLTELFG